MRKISGWRIALTAPFALFIQIDCRADTFVVAEPEDVADVALRDADFSDWNYGREITLEAGYIQGLYELHHGVSLIRFNLTGLPCKDVESATLRLYKPRSFSQLHTATCSVYEVSQANADWVEGSEIGDHEDASSTWRGKGAGRSWAGAEGCSKAGVDFKTPAIGSITSTPQDSGWVAFKVPAKLVQKWLSDPTTNTGFYLAADGEQKLGGHVQLDSSEHYSGKGPQLVIEGKRGDPPSKRIAMPFNPRYPFPPADAEAYIRYKKENDSIRATWATLPDFGMTPEQGLGPYYWDILARADVIVVQNQVPLSDCVVRLQEQVRNGDEEGARKTLDDVRKGLLKWENARQARSYHSGIMAEGYSGRTLAAMWGMPKVGRFSLMPEKKWVEKTPEELDEIVKSEIEKHARERELTEEQIKAMTPYLREYTLKQCHYAAQTGKRLKQIAALLAGDASDDELHEAASTIYYEHLMYNYWGSDFSAPRWHMWLDRIGAPAIPLAEEFLNARADNYNPNSLKDQIAKAKEYYWYPPILYVSPDAYPGGVGSRDWPCRTIAEAVEIASDANEIRVVGKLNKDKIDLKGKNLTIVDGYNSTFTMRATGETIVE